MVSNALIWHQVGIDVILKAWVDEKPLLRLGSFLSMFNASLYRSPFQILSISNILIFVVNLTRSSDVSSVLLPWCIFKHRLYPIHMALRWFRIGLSVKCMFDWSFSYRSLRLSYVVFTTTVNFVNYLRFAQRRDFVFGRRKIFRLVVLNKVFKSLTFFFRKYIIRLSPVEPMYGTLNQKVISSE